VYGKANLIVLCLSLLVTMGLTSCRQQATVPSPDVPVRELLINFFATTQSTQNNEVRLEIGVSSVSGRIVPADPAFEGIWRLTGPDGATRAGGDITQLQEMAGGNEAVLVEWQGLLLTGIHELTWGAPNYGGMILTFDVLEQDDAILIGDQHIHNTTAFPPAR
jgi:hypothetical protein